MPAFVVRNIWISEPSVSDSDANRHWQPPPNKSLVCRSAFRRALHSTKCHRRERHRYNSVWLVEHAPSRLVRLRKSFQSPHPNSKRNEYPGRRWSRRRFRFFLAHKGVKFIQLSLPHLGWQGSRWQLRSVALNPICHTLWVDLQNSGYRAIATAFHIHSDG